MQLTKKNSGFAFLLAMIILITPSGAMAEKKSKPSKKAKEEIDITRITSKGELLIDYKEKVAEFHKDVVVEDKNGTMTADYVKVIFTSDGSGVSKIIAAGHVVIKQKERTATSNDAVYVVQTEVLRLFGNPKITEKGNMYTADEITVLCKENKVLFKPSAKIVIKNTEIPVPEKGKP